MLTVEDFIAVRITKFAHDRVLLPNLVAFSCQIHDFAVAILGYGRSVQIASYKIGIRHELFADEARTSQVDGRRRLYALERKTDCGRVGPGRRTQGSVVVHR